IFDMEKLRWMNGEYIRKLSLDEFKEVATPYFKKPIKKRDVDYDVLSRLLHTRTEVLSEIPEQLDFVDELPDYDIELYTHKRMKTNPENALIHLKEAYKVLEELEDWSFDSIHDSLMDLVKKLGVKNGQVLW